MRYPQNVVFQTEHIHIYPRFHSYFYSYRTYDVLTPVTTNHIYVGFTLTASRSQVVREQIDVIGLAPDQLSLLLEEKSGGKAIAIWGKYQWKDNDIDISNDV